MARQKRAGRKRKCRRLINPKFIRFKQWIATLISLSAFIFTAMPGFSGEELLWEVSDAGIDENGVTAICVVKARPEAAFAGADRSIYKSTDSGRQWSRALMLKGERRGINFICSDPNDPSRVFAATADGLYASCDEGINWRRIFKGMDDFQRRVNCIAISPDSSKIMIGTDKGLFESPGTLKDWSAEETFMNKTVKSIAMNDNSVYVCASDGVYSLDKGSSLWDRIFVARLYEEEEIDTYGKADSDTEDNLDRLNFLLMYGGNLYLATDYGLYLFLSKRKEWTAFTCEGLLTQRIVHILARGEKIFAATEKGAFEYDKDKGLWRSRSTGLTSLKVNMLAAPFSSGYILAATGRGIFKARLRKAGLKDDIVGKGTPDTEDYAGIFGKEPDILQIQQAAIEYAEVSPDKIKWMRTAAKHKALLPKLSLGFDGDTGRTIGLDRGGTNDPDFYIEGPRDKNFGWDVDISWDLGELIWNDDQANIDVRSRLMVQLRNDVLDEVTNLYFERRRLQLELLRKPSDKKDKRMLKELRINELTANIDALTGGYLSDYMRK